MLIAVCVAALIAVAPNGARAQGKLEAQYTATVAGIPIGKGSWVIEINDTQYKAAATGVTTGLVRVFTGGKGTSAAQGSLLGGKPITSIYASTITSSKKEDDVSLTVANGNVKEFKVEPPLDHDTERVPVTEEHQRGILDPMTAFDHAHAGQRQAAVEGSLRAHFGDLRRPHALRPAARLQAHGYGEGGQGLFG